MNCHHVEAFKTMELDEVIWKRVNVLKKKKKEDPGSWSQENYH